MCRDEACLWMCVLYRLALLLFNLQQVVLQTFLHLTRLFLRRGFLGTQPRDLKHTNAHTNTSGIVLVSVVVYLSKAISHNFLLSESLWLIQVSYTDANIHLQL